MSKNISDSLKKKLQSIKAHPFVSVCTPTFNRRPFISHMIKCFDHQDYPKDRLEWIIIDDGTDKIRDLVENHPLVKYYGYDTKMTLGKKRNLMHEKCRGDIIVYMDDDDYYPPTRISHAVETLKNSPDALCAGSSEMYIYFKHINKMYQFGPYGPNHATAASFAFRKELLNITKYDNDASLAEEKAFLKGYSIPFVQLDPLKTILVFSHIHNTFDKRKLLENPDPRTVRESNKVVSDFVKEPGMRDFYMNQINGLLKKYEPGKAEMKPDVIKQIKKIDQEREKMMQDAMKNNPSGIMFQSTNGGPPVNLTMQQVTELLQNQQKQLHELNSLLQGKDQEISLLNSEIERINKENEHLNNHMADLHKQLIIIQGTKN